MKNLFVFYLLILLPIIAAVILVKYEIIDNVVFFISIFFYTLIYRTLTDGIKLYKNGKIQKKDIWKLILPGNRLEHFRALYLE